MEWIAAVLIFTMNIFSSSVITQHFSLRL
ncbi:hypothetical protein FORC098_0997 [Salmonella enterica subsp. enterica serovar Typhimurium]|nr:hypothetical protein FORC098_0997 [Salmonella enterica subsp. enterica serovar Typhimurium]